ARPVRATQAYPLHSSVYSTTSGRVAWPTNHCKVAASTVSATHNWISPVSRPTTPSTGGRSVSQVPWPRTLLARRRGGSSGWPCFLPFFPRILEHLVGLGFGVGQRSPGQGAPGQVLQAVAQLQQVPAAAPQLSGQLGGRRPLGDAADDQNQLAGAALRALQGRAGPGVEDAPAGAPVVQDGVAMSPMDGQVATATGRAAQAPRMEGLDQEVVAGLRVQQVVQGEVHGGASAGSGQLPYSCSTRPAVAQKPLTTDLGP